MPYSSRLLVSLLTIVLSGLSVVALPASADEPPPKHDPICYDEYGDEVSCMPGDPNAAPAAPVGLVASPGENASVTSTTPTFSAAASDAEGQAVQLRFELLKQGSPVWSGSTGFVPSGSSGSVTLPTSYLTVGESFSVRATATDGNSYGLPTVADYVVESAQPAADPVTDPLTVNTYWDATLSCMRDNNEVDPSLSVAQVLGSLNSAQTALLPPSMGSNAPDPSAGCSLGAQYAVVDAVRSSPDVAAVNSSLSGLRADIDSGAVEVSRINAPAASTSSTCPRPAIGLFFDSLNHRSDVAMSTFTYNASTQNPCFFNWNTNLCTASPNSGPTFNFSDSCRRHDFAYTNLKRAEGWYNNYNLFGLRNINVADEQLLRDMNAHCATRNLAAAYTCSRVAKVYYTAVSTRSNSLGYTSTLTFISNPPPDLHPCLC